MMLLLTLLASGCANPRIKTSSPADAGQARADVALRDCRFEERGDLKPFLPATPASEVCRTEDLKDVERLTQTLPKETTLVIFDIDDTMLTATGESPDDHFFGSDAWFRWQMDLPKDSSDKIGCLLDDLLAFDYESARLRLTQPDAAQIFNRITNDKLFLTSRSLNYRGGTERELLYRGIVLPAQLPGHGPIFLRDDEKNLPMNYANGIFMSSGANKGKALVKLLGDKHRYRIVILVDDGGKNIFRMKEALAEKTIDYYGLQYERIKHDPYPNALPLPTQPQINESRNAMTRWLTFMRDQYPARYAALKSTCGDYPLPPAH